MKNLVSLLLTILLYSSASGQTITELYNNKDYQALIKLEKKKLTPHEMYMVGVAFFKLENNNKAIELYDKAIREGFDSAFIHLDKAISLSYAKRLDEAIEEFDIAIKKDPDNQMYMSEKGFAYYYAGDMNKALPVFQDALKLPNNYQVPFYMVAHIYHINQEYDKALKEFYNALNNISKDNKYYLKTLADIGRLEYTVTKNFGKSVEAYQQALNLDPKNYELYPKLIKAFNANKNFSKADSIFNFMKIAFENNELSEETMKFKDIDIDEDELNGQKIAIYKSFVDPQKSLDVSFRIYFFNKAGDTVERTFMVEQTIQLPDGPKHLLCEKDKETGEHITYPYSWETDNIHIDDIKKAVRLVLDEKMKPAASSI